MSDYEHDGLLTATIPDLFSVSARGGVMPEHMRFVSPEFVLIGRDGVPVPAAKNALMFNTIQAAIDSITAETGGNADRSDGYTVVVYPGVYVESITMQSNVSLIGTSEISVFIKAYADISST